MVKIALAVAALVGGAALAHAHGAASWIMEDPATKHCCGPDDCHMEMGKDIVPTKGGWIVASSGQRIGVDDENVYPSIDANYWTCRKARNAREDMNGTPHVDCLFVPMQS